MTGFHIAELNVARLKHAIFDPRISDFVNNLNRVNAVAERSPGFVWRKKDETGSSISMSPDNDPMIIPNLSVWEDVLSLENFVFKTVHKRFYERRAEWFGLLGKMHFVMWPVPVGHEPSLEEAWQKLDQLNTQGSTEQAFDWSYIQQAQLWRTGQCGVRAV
ncbi:DUF3291 domain-containing protein [Roseibium sp.]|uniref:DUF3291 domain-containing protein n=1 Tax=Roseibium sp. TaxID=1936156 RepID=UPI003D0A7BD4